MRMKIKNKNYSDLMRKLRKNSRKKCKIIELVDDRIRFDAWKNCKPWEGESYILFRALGTSDRLNERRDSRDCRPGVRGRSSPPDRIYHLIFTMCHIICVSDNRILASIYLIPQTLCQRDYKNTHFSTDNKNIVYF